jgi:hypothetical protein
MPDSTQLRPLEEKAAKVLGTGSTKKKEKKEQARGPPADSERLSFVAHHLHPTWDYR